MATQPPKAVLIITGAWQVPEHYGPAVSGLAARGIRVLCPRLPTNNNAYPPDKYLEDDVAFVRFASVYKNFGAADDFRSFLSELKDGEQPTLGEDDD